MDDDKLSCTNFPSDSTSSIITDVCNLPKKLTIPVAEASPSCLSSLTTSSSSSTVISAEYFKDPCYLHKPKRGDPPNIKYELAIAKSVLKQYSTLSGDNLFDHLSDIIKRVIDERPPNVIDFFEEFSRNVREQKFHQPERFPPDAVFEENRLYRLAKKLLLSIKLPYPESPTYGSETLEEMEYEEKPVILMEDLSLNLHDNLKSFKILNERVQQLQFYWNQCGFSIDSDDIFQLACSMDRLQNHYTISQCRFWGTIYGLKSSYYIVEALLTSAECNRRISLLQEELKQKKYVDLNILKEGPKNILSSLIGPELIPGNYGWENWPVEEVNKMTPLAAPIPIIETPFIFDVPPEPVGAGVNRFSYFVVNSLSDDWMELPIATPKQICISRQIKKFFTGDLEADVHSYPCFPGKEKHLLRATIARITAGTYIAPRGYYRKMTKREKKLLRKTKSDDDEEQEEEEEEVEEEELEDEGEEPIENDILLLLSEYYNPEPLKELANLSNWLHVRPNILNQGRIVYFNVDKARRAWEKELTRLLKMEQMEEEELEDEEEEENEDAEEEDEEEEDDYDELLEKGPSILSPIDMDFNNEGTLPWVARFTSAYTNKNERVLVMRSNTWPGAFSFTFEKTCESIYLGWGHKYVARNMPFVHIPPITGEYPHEAHDFEEANDPTVLDEEEYRQWLLRKQQRLKAMREYDLIGGEEALSDVGEELVPED